MFKFFILLLTTPLILDILKEQFQKMGYGSNDDIAKKLQEFDLFEKIKFVQTEEDEIYWFEDDKMYMSTLNEEGTWDPEDRMLVSFTNLNKNELEKLIIIISALTER
jgi:hypothetical protein